MNAEHVAELREARANIEKLIIRNNELTRERDNALRKARRLPDVAAIDELCRKLCAAARALGENRTGSGVDRLRVANAIAVMTDVARVLDQAGGYR